MLRDVGVLTEVAKKPHEAKKITAALVYISTKLSNKRSIFYQESLLDIICLPKALVSI